MIWNAVESVRSHFIAVIADVCGHLIVHLREDFVKECHQVKGIGLDIDAEFLHGLLIVEYNIII